jgi:hypothetical protein
MITDPDLIFPELDGVSHINVYSKGKTEVGRMLSNFHYAPFECRHGRFASIEGYWYWLGIAPCRDRELLRMLFGPQAKNYGRLVRADFPQPLPETEFQEYIKKAIWRKICKYQNIWVAVRESSLPFEHYYVFENRVSVPENCEWLIEFLEQARNYIKEHDADTKSD